MLGYTFFLLQKFVQKELGTEILSQLFVESGVAPKLYILTMNYPDEEMVALIKAASRLSGRTTPELLESLGYFLVPDLLGLFRDHIQPQWKTLDLIENVESMHDLARQQNSEARPPILQCLRISENELQLIYTSTRQLCETAKGVIRGMAAHYQESVDIVEHTCMHHGSPFCTFQLSVASIAKTDPAETIFESSGVQTQNSPNPWHAITPTPTKTSSASPFSEIPTQILHYRILERLGTGGMGVVYKAEDEMLKRNVALKLMLPAIASSPQNRERFLREARAMAALTNEHIVTVHQVGNFGDLPFIVMQLLIGMTLEDRLKQNGSLPYSEIVRIGLEIANGLAVAHGAGLVHRDVKPANIWIEEPGGRIKILDFGLVRAEVGDAQMTRVGVIVGTPLYMSPEQAFGDTVDSRSDLFSLGVILYRMCAGQPPFQGDSMAAIIKAIGTETPRPLSEVRSDVPPQLANVIMQLLAKNPAERLESASASADALSHIGLV